MDDDRTDQITSQSLLVRVRNVQDKDAWAAFVHIYAPIIFSYCRFRKLQDSDAADVTQEVLLNLSKSLANFEYQPDRGRFRDWLGRVTHRELLHFWKRKRRNAATASVVELEPVEDPSSWEQHFHSEILQLAIQRIRNEFSQDSWSIFEQLWLLDRPAKEVADTFSVSMGSLYMTKSRILKRLRSEVIMLSEDLPLLGPDGGKLSLDEISDASIRGGLGGELPTE